jgi:hypothetical protein
MNLSRLFPLDSFFPFALVRIVVIAIKIPLFQIMELLRSRLDAEVFGDGPPSFSLIFLVSLYHDFKRPRCHLPDPKALVCVPKGF